MPSRNLHTRPLTWKIARNKRLANAIKKSGWQVAWVWTNIIASVDHFGRMEGGAYQVRDMFFPHMPEVFPDQVDKWLDTLEEEGLLIRYEHSGQFIQLPKIGVYQKLSGNVSPVSDFPEPPAEKIAGWEEKFGERYVPLIVRKVKTVDDSKKLDAIETIGAYWNSKQRLSKINHWNAERTEKLRERLRSKGFKENWQKAIDKIADSSFCCGGGKTGWRATFDWFIRNDSNWIKAVEGRYDDRKQNSFDELIRTL